MLKGDALLRVEPQLASHKVKSLPGAERRRRGVNADPQRASHKEQVQRQ